MSITLQPLHSVQWWTVPSGKVHDQITIYTAAVSAPAWFLLTGGSDPASYLAALLCYLFSGIWLSGDLDTNSAAYKRWGAMRFLWWPYRTLVPHRSWLSHGLGIGPLVRTLYFVVVAWAVIELMLSAASLLITPIDQRGILGEAARGITQLYEAHRHLALWAVAGLILGGVTHSLLDSLVTRTKKLW